MANYEILIRDAQHHRWLAFREPLQVITVYDLAKVLPALHTIEAHVGAGGYAAGFISYEAAPAFDPAFRTLPSGVFPLLHFGIFSHPVVVEPPAGEPSQTLNWEITTPVECYRQSIDTIKTAIARGDTYQVNYTIRQIASFADDPRNLFAAIAGDAPFAAFVDMKNLAICSASPELFFEKHADRITARPMKGTAPRGRFTAEDRRLRQMLADSPKDRAENAMIVDMLRNDIGRIARTGSVAVVNPFQIEKYSTVWQMTSTVTARTDAGISDIFRALFPCASITGAPKISTMQIIAKIEDTPRNIYTGTIGFIAPSGDCRFNVAIRTALIDKRKQQIEYGIGSGVVWDSQPDQEYRECLWKARVITGPRRTPVFELLETLLWEPSEGYYLMEYHLRRLRDSADYFDYRYDEPAVLDRLSTVVANLPAVPHKVRLLVSRAGDIRCEAAPLPAQSRQKPLKIQLAKTPVDSNDRFLYHKTTRRDVYERAKSDHPDCDEVLLWNENHEITEGTICNVAVRLGGDWLTPPVDCGLLNGTFRQHLLDEGKIAERVITVDALKNAEGIALFNSLRKWLPARLCRIATK